MANKTYYPTFRRDVRRLLIYVSKHGAAMQASLAIGGTGFQTDFNNLVNALNQIENNWPAYVEPQ
jgi:hypothetical protein